MLVIRRVPTLLSLNQDEEKAKSCEKNCLSTCCLTGATIPAYYFARQYSVKPKRVHSYGDLHTVPDIYNSSSSSSDSGSDSEGERSFLDSLLLAQWEDRAERGLFRYDVTACETKVLPGEYGFIAQLNEGRHLKKRPTEFRVDQVVQPYDPSRFNFTKVSQEEVLFRFEESGDGGSTYSETQPVGSAESPNVVLINVSPIEYGHVLLVPRVLDRIPQLMDPETTLLAVHMALEADNPYLRLGYNSLGAYATINHLHFQAYYLEAPFPVERAPTVRIPLLRKRSRSVKLSELRQYPVRGLVFEVGSSLEELALVVGRVCQRLQEWNLPHNVLIADMGARVFLFPQCFAERQARGEVDATVLETQVNPAVWEISGHIVLKRREDYDKATENWAWNLLAEVSLPEDRFKEVTALCLEELEKVRVEVPLAVVPSNCDGDEEVEARGRNAEGALGGPPAASKLATNWEQGSKVQSGVENEGAVLKSRAEPTGLAGRLKAKEEEDGVVPSLVLPV